MDGKSWGLTHEDRMEDGEFKKGLPKIKLIGVGGVSDLRRRIDYASWMSNDVDTDREGARDAVCDFRAPLRITVTLAHPRRPYRPPHVQPIFS
jgi:hypothetical protein